MTEFQKYMGEFAQWYHYNRNHNMDPDKFVEFATRAIDCLSRTVVVLGEEVQRLQRVPADAALRRLVVPRGVILNDRITG
jgi:hypothetical protein